MSKVAAAIEAAASPKQVDQSLWWDISFAELLQHLENPPPPPAQASFVETLREYKDCLLNSLEFFKPPNSESKSAVNGSEMVVGNHTIRIDSKLRNITLRLSSYLVLDEVQTYLFVSRVTKFDSILLQDEFDPILKLIGTKYFMERQCLLKCILQILMYKLTNENGTCETIREQADELLNDGLEQRTVDVLEHLILAQRPSNLDIYYADLWCEETLIEEIHIMDILFLLYYLPGHICTADNWNKIFSIFKDIISGFNNTEQLVITPAAQNYALHIRFQAVLILLEGLDFDSVLCMLFNEVPFCQGSHSFSFGDLQETENSISILNSLELSETRLVIFMWAVFSCLVSMLPATDEPFVLDVNHLAYIRQAVNGGALDAVYKMLCSDAFQAVDFQGQVTAYKSVLKTLMSGFIAAYDINQDERILDTILNILCEIYSGQEGLCLEFWDSESIIDRPIQSLLPAVMKYFPMKILPVLRFLLAVCEGNWASISAYNFLCKKVNMTTLVNSQCIESCQERPETVKAHFNLQIPGAESLIINAGCTGYIIKVLKDGALVVCWEALYPIIFVILFMLTREISSIQIYEETVGILELLHRILSFNKELSLRLFDLVHPSVYTASERQDSLRVDIVRIFCTLIDNLVQNNTNSKAVGLSIACLCKLSDCHPAKVLPDFLRTELFQFKMNEEICGDGCVLPDGLSRFLSHDGDQTGGDYSLTVLYLDLCNHLVEKGVQVKLASNLVMYAVRYILVNHGNWKYKSRYQRWQIASKVFKLIQVCIASNGEQYPASLKVDLMEILLYDAAVIEVLLQAICINSEKLEGRYINCYIEPKEFEWIQQSVCSSLDVIADVLTNVINDDTSKEYAGPIHLEQLLLCQSMPNFFMSSLISLLGVARSNSLQLVSARLLACLCVIAQRLRPHPVSLETFLTSSNQRKYLNSTVCDALSEDNVKFNAELVSAYIELLTSAALYQPSFLKTMLLGEESRKGKDKDTNTHGTSNGIDLITKHLNKCESLLAGQPYVLAKILGLLAAIWKEGTQHLRILDHIITNEMFWKCLLSCISSLTYNEGSSSCSLVDEEVSVKALQYQCQSSVLDIVSQHLFFQRQFIQTATPLLKSANASATSSHSKIDNGNAINGDVSVVLKSFNDSSMDDALVSWIKTNTLQQINKHFAYCLFDKEIFMNLKGVERALVVAIMARILSGDCMGLNLPLVEQMQSVSQKVIENAAFIELLEQYRRKGYGNGRELQAFSINDLYCCLQGELEGKKIPQGPFQIVSGYLSEMKLDSILNIKKSIQNNTLSPMYYLNYIYDAKALENSLGFEWLDICDNRGFKGTAEKMLEGLIQSNKVSFLADSQLKALDAWTSLLALLLSHNKLATGNLESRLDSSFSEETISLCIQDICDYILTTMHMLEACHEQISYFKSFLKGQVQLLFILEGWMYQRRNLINKARSWSVYAKIIRTAITCLKSLMVLRTHEFEILDASLLVVILTALESIRSQNVEQPHNNQSREEAQDIGDAFADVSLVCLGFLPFLCSFIESKNLLHISVAIVDSLLKGFLEPRTCLPILQKHFPTDTVLGQLLSENWKGSASTVLNLCLTLARVRKGAEMLQQAGFFSCFSEFCRSLRSALATDPVNIAPYAFWHTWGPSDGLWGLGIAVVTAMLNSFDENAADISVIDNAMTCFLTEMDHIMSKLCSPDIIYGAVGKDGMKPQKLNCSLLALRETENCIILMHQLAKHQVTWFNVMQDMDSKLRVVCVHLLAFISKEGAHATESKYSYIILQCPPVQKEESTAHERPSIINCKTGWFAVAAKGSVTINRWGRFGQGKQTAPSESDGVITSSEYTDSIAIQVYRIALRILSFLCMQAQLTVKIFDETGTIDVARFPELPVPEILHSLQDQAMGIIMELVQGSQENFGKPQVKSLCLLLVRIIEKSLYLEVCVTRICGISSVLGRPDGFPAKYNAIISGLEDKQFLEAQLLALKRIAVLAYPGLS